MIMVDVYVPAFDKEYDFCLNQNVRIDTVIEEISEMIARKERSKIVGNIGELMLCDRQEGKILGRNKTLCVCGVRTGSKLMLL